MDARVRTAGPAEAAPCADAAVALIEARRTILPKRLVAPGPDIGQLHQILAAASSAPDHGELVPWRFVIVPAAWRASLGAAFADALRERDPGATPEQEAQAHDKATRAPVLLLAVVRGPEDARREIPWSERHLSAGCAIQNMLLVATAQGFGSALTSGKAMASAQLRSLFRLRACEQAVCFISIGTVGKAKPPRQRPGIERYVSILGGAA
jgi:nitroreductase